MITEKPPCYYNTIFGDLWDAIFISADKQEIDLLINLSPAINNINFQQMAAPDALFRLIYECLCFLDHRALAAGSDNAMIRRITDAQLEVKKSAKLLLDNYFQANSKAYLNVKKISFEYLRVTKDTRGAKEGDITNPAILVNLGNDNFIPSQLILEKWERIHPKDIHMGIKQYQTSEPIIKAMNTAQAELEFDMGKLCLVPLCNFLGTEALEYPRDVPENSMGSNASALDSKQFSLAPGCIGNNHRPAGSILPIKGDGNCLHYSWTYAFFLNAIRDKAFDAIDMFINGFPGIAEISKEIKILSEEHEVNLKNFEEVFAIQESDEELISVCREVAQAASQQKAALEQTGDITFLKTMKIFMQKARQGSSDCLAYLYEEYQNNTVFYTTMALYSRYLIYLEVSSNPDRKFDGEHTYSEIASLLNENAMDVNNIIYETFTDYLTIKHTKGIEILKNYLRQNVCQDRRYGDAFLGFTIKYISPISIPQINIKKVPDGNNEFHSVLYKIDGFEVPIQGPFGQILHKKVTESAAVLFDGHGHYEVIIPQEFLDSPFFNAVPTDEVQIDSIKTDLSLMRKEAFQAIDQSVMPILLDESRNDQASVKEVQEILEKILGEYYSRSNHISQEYSKMDGFQRASQEIVETSKLLSCYKNILDLKIILSHYLENKNVDNTPVLIESMLEGLAKNHKNTDTIKNGIHRDKIKECLFSIEASFHERFDQENKNKKNEENKIVAITLAVDDLINRLDEWTQAFDKIKSQQGLQETFGREHEALVNTYAVIARGMSDVLKSFSAENEDANPSLTENIRCLKGNLLEAEIKANDLLEEWFCHAFLKSYVQEGFSIFSVRKLPIEMLKNPKTSVRDRLTAICDHAFNDPNNGGRTRKILYNLMFKSYAAKNAGEFTEYTPVFCKERYTTYQLNKNSNHQSQGFKYKG